MLQILILVGRRWCRLDNTLFLKILFGVNYKLEKWNKLLKIHFFRCGVNEIYFLPYLFLYF